MPAKFTKSSTKKTRANTSNTASGKNVAAVKTPRSKKSQIKAAGTGAAKAGVGAKKAVANKAKKAAAPMKAAADKKKVSAKKTVTFKKSTTTQKTAGAKKSVSTATKKPAASKKSATPKQAASSKKTNTVKKSAAKKNLKAKSDTKTASNFAAKKSAAALAKAGKAASAKKPVTAKKSSEKTLTAEPKTTKKAPAKTIKAAKAANAPNIAAANKQTIERLSKNSMTTIFDAKPESPAVGTAKAESALKIFGVDPYQQQTDEEYMNEQQRSHFRQILLNWKKELMEEVDRTVHHMKDDAQRFADPSDSATQEEEFSLELRARDRERKLIKKIDEALERIEQDEYGYCDACGVDIGIRRLEARPTATLCIDCKTLDEIREKQTRV